MCTLEICVCFQVKKGPQKGTKQLVVKRSIPLEGITGVSLRFASSVVVGDDVCFCFVFS